MKDNLANSPMPYYLDKEYHPVIEDFIIQYTEGKLDETEAETFEELLIQDDDLRELTFAAIGGKYLLEEYQDRLNEEGISERILNSIKKSESD